MQKFCAVAARRGQGVAGRVGDIFSPHGAAEFPADNVSGDVIKDGRQTEPPEAMTFRRARPVCHIRSGGVVLSLNASAALITTQDGLVLRSADLTGRQTEAGVSGTLCI